MDFERSLDGSRARRALWHFRPISILFLLDLAVSATGVPPPQAIKNTSNVVSLIYTPLREMYLSEQGRFCWKYATRSPGL